MSLSSLTAFAFDSQRFWDGNHYREGDVELISESAEDLAAGNNFDSAPLVAPGVYQGSFLTAALVGKIDDVVTTGESKFFKVHLEYGQKVTALLNTKREKAIDTEDPCANIEPFILIYSNPGPENMVAGQVSSRPLLGLEINPDPWSISPRDDNAFHSNKAEYPFSRLGKEVVPEPAPEGDYFVVIGSRWFIECPDYSEEDLKNSPVYVSSRMGLEEKKRQNSRVLYKLKINVTGSVEEYEEYLKEQELKDAAYQIEADKRYHEEIANDPVKKKAHDELDAYMDAQSKELKAYMDSDDKEGDLADESDYFDEEDESNPIKNILIGLGVCIFIGGAGAAIFLYSRKRKAEGGSLVPADNFSDNPTYQAQALCPNCGSSIDPATDFCGKCGNKLK